MISVVIPCFRQAAFLWQAIESVLSQSVRHDNVEIIVVNDGSDDHTSDVARSYSGVQLIERANGGLPAARNSGIGAAKGDLLLFLDADDLLLPTALATLLSQMPAQHDAMVVGGCRTFERDPAFGTAEAPRFIPTDLIRGLVEYNIGPVHSFLVPRSAVVAVGGFDETLKSCEDWDLWSRLATYGLGAVFVREPVALYRKYAGSMSSFTARMAHERSRVLIGMHDRLISDEKWSALYGGHLLDIELRVARRLAVHGVGGEVVEQLWTRICKLKDLGFKRRCSAARRVLENVVGVRCAEWISLATLRLLKPEHVRHLTGCHT